MLIGSAGLSSCSGGRGQVSGQVFIVTQGRDNVRLGLVSVQLLRASEVQSHVKLLRTRFDSLRAVAKMRNEESIQAAADQLQANLGRLDSLKSLLRPKLALVERQLLNARYVAATLREQSVTADKRYADAHMKGIMNNPSFRVGDEPAEKELRERDSIQEKALVAEEDAKRLEAQATELRRKLSQSAEAPVPELATAEPLTSAEVFRELPKPLATSQTDADGRFSIKLPGNGSYALAAQAERLLPSGSEKYFWLVRLPESAKKGTPVLLSNTLLTSSESELSLFRDRDDAQDH